MNTTRPLIVSEKGRAVSIVIAGSLVFANRSRRGKKRRRGVRAIPSLQPRTAGGKKAISVPAKRHLHHPTSNQLKAGENKKKENKKNNIILTTNVLRGLRPARPSNPIPPKEGKKRKRKGEGGLLAL